jgi:uncharacterized delta-60 repeat protein
MMLSQSTASVSLGRIRMTRFAIVLIVFMCSSGARGFALDAPDGSLDPTFGIGGKVITNFGSVFDDPAGVAVQRDGKILIAGRSLAVDDDTTDFVIARFNADGTPDVSFGVDGKVTTDIGGGTDDTPSAIAIQPDGRILVVGTTINLRLFHINFVLVRYNGDGSIDSSFGQNGGTVIVEFKSPVADTGSAVAVQPDGKILVGGKTNLTFTISAFALARFNADGSLDESFGSGGKVRLPFPAPYTQAVLSQLAIQPDGKIVAMGSAATGVVVTNLKFDFAVARFNADGSLDPTFGGGSGLVTTEINGPNDFGLDGALQEDGRIVVAGHAGTAQSKRFVVVRYGIDGSLDPDFGGTGIVTTAFPRFGTQADTDTIDIATSVAIQKDGKIVATGFHVGAVENFALARYLKDGALDATFGSGGLVTTSFSSSTDPVDASVAAMVLQDDGRIVTTGAISNQKTHHTALARYAVSP